MKRAVLAALIVLAAGAFLVLSTGASNGNSEGTYKIQLDNAFGLVPGADFKVGGVRAGTIKSLDLDQKTLHAVVTVEVTVKGFGQFHSDTFCQSRPQSLIGEYFVDCQPGSHGQVLKPGSTIPVTRTQSTIPGDLLQNVMRMPYRQRFTLIINELGAAVAARSEDLQSALRRAVPALTETDNLLTLLANDSHTLQDLTANSDTVITALANNSRQVARFVDEAGHTAQLTANQQGNLRTTFARLPGFLEQLRPSMAQLARVTDTNTPALVNLHAAAQQVDRLLVDLPGFSHSSLPAIRSLGQASVTGKTAVIAARPTIKDLNTFAKSTPELAQNLNIVLHDLDNRSRATEADSRSPGGQGYTGLEALLQYVFNQTMAINTFGPFGHLLAVDAFIDPACTPYASPATIAQNLKALGAGYRHCYSWLGPNQPGINETDPSNPSACVPDPGAGPPGLPGPTTSACKLAAADVKSARDAARVVKSAQAATTTTAASTPAPGTAAPSAQPRSGSAPAAGARGNIAQSLGALLSGALGGGGSSAPSAAPSSSSGSGQTQQLLNYLLAP